MNELEQMKVTGEFMQSCFQLANELTSSSKELTENEKKFVAATAKMGMMAMLRSLGGIK